MFLRKLLQFVVATLACSILWEVAGIVILFVIALVVVAVDTVGPVVLLVPLLAFIVWLFFRRDTLRPRESLSVFRRTQRAFMEETERAAGERNETVGSDGASDTEKGPTKDGRGVRH